MRRTVATQAMNWAGNFGYSARDVRYPASVAELADIVAGQDRVRALGTRHSFSAIADSPGVLVSLSGIAPEISIDSTAMTVSVTGGTRYGVLAQVLQDNGFALHNMGSLPHISVAGGTATGTHGSGDGNGILATAICAVELVTADGSIVVVDRNDPDLAALAVGLGAFGVIARLTLDIEPTYLVRQDVYFDAPWDGVIERLDEIMSSAYSVSLMGDLGAPTVLQLWQKSRIDDGVPDVDIPRSAFGGTWYDDANDIAKTSLNVRGGVPGPWADRLPHFRLDSAPSVGGDELQTEYFVDRRHAVKALRVLRDMGERLSPHLHAAEIRTVAADAMWLSPAFERDCLSIGFTWRKHPAAVGALLPVIEHALAGCAPRPHWGKLFHFGAAELAGRFPRLSDFRTLATSYDPEGKFWNPFLDGVLGPRPT